MRYLLKQGVKCIEEGSLARVWQHTKERPIGIITAFRSRYTLKENRARNQRLVSMVRAAGFGYFRLKRHYVEGFGTGQTRDVAEESFLVMGAEGPDKGRLRALLVRAGSEFFQDAVLYKDATSPTAFLLGTSSQDEDGNPVTFPGKGKEVAVGEWKPSRIAQFYSTLRGGRTFVFESIEDESVMGAWAEHACRRSGAEM